MASPHILNVTDENFATEVLQSNKPTLVDFWATWCPPCVAIAPSIDAIASSMTDQLKVCKMDIDHNQTTPAQYNIRSIPTLLIFHKGQVIAQQIGAAPRAKLEQFVTNALAQAAGK